MRKLICTIVGSKAGGSAWDESVALMAEQAGRAAAEAGFVVLTGGKSGVMESAAKGAQAVGGLTMGVLPDGDVAAGNQFLDLVLPTGIGIARNFLTAMFCDVMVALPGGRGTLEEMCFALDYGKPVVTWKSFLNEIPLQSGGQVIIVSSTEDLFFMLKFLHQQLAARMD